MKTQTLLVIALLLSTQSIGCKKGADNVSAPGQMAAQLETSESEIRSAIQTHLAHKGNLNLQAFDTNIQQVTFQGNKAEAKVAFHIKNGPGVMELTYHLEKKSDVWVVIDSQPTGSDFPHPQASQQEQLDSAPSGGSHSLSDTLRNFKEEGREAPSK